MSLLLEALQKASKNRDEAKAGTTGDLTAMADELSLEPTMSAPDALPDSAGSPTAAQAATLLQARSVPGFNVLDYAREHYMISFLGFAILFALGYGTYVYVQVAQPFRSPTPALAPLVAAPQSAAIASAPPPDSAKITGLPGGMTSSDGSAGAGAMAATANAADASGQPAPPASAPVFDEPMAMPAARKKTSAKPASAPRAKAASRSTSNSAPLTDAGDRVETIVIPTSRPEPGGVEVRKDATRQTQVTPVLMQAYEALQRGENAKARELYEQFLQREPRSIDALLGLGAIALGEGRLDDASGYYQRILALDPRNSYAQAGLISIVGGADRPASESRLKQLIARDPSAFLNYSLGNLYAEQGQWPSAQQAYFQAFQMQQDNPDYAFNLAVGLDHLGQDKLALDYYRKALDLSFKKGHANFDQTLVIQRVGQLSARVEQ